MSLGRVLVTGATGFIGYEVARCLAERGLSPRLLVRRPLRAPLVSGLDAEPVQGDLESPASLERALRGIDTVLHLAARATFEEYRRVAPSIVSGSANLLAAARSAGVQRLVFSSSLLVHDSQPDPIDAQTQPGSGMGYGRAKVEAEELLADGAADAGIAFAALRLPHVYGARDLMFGQVQRGRVVLPGNGRNVLSHMHVRDAARLLIGVAERGWTGISPVADLLPVSWLEFFDEVRKYYPRFRTLAVPYPLARLGTALLTPLRWTSRAPSIYTPEAVEGWNRNLAVAPGLVWKEIGLEPLHPTIHHGIPAALDECVAFRWVHPVLDRSG